MQKTLFPRVRPRRLRLNETIRDLVSETNINRSKLIQPLFVSDTLKNKGRNSDNARSISLF